MTVNEFVGAYNSKKGLVPIVGDGNQRRAYAFWRMNGCPKHMLIEPVWINPSEENEGFGCYGNMNGSVKRASVKDKIINHLKVYGEINKYKASSLYGCNNLSSCISNIRATGTCIIPVKVNERYRTYTKYVLDR